MSGASFNGGMVHIVGDLPRYRLSDRWLRERKIKPRHGNIGENEYRNKGCNCAEIVFHAPNSL